MSEEDNAKLGAYLRFAGLAHRVQEVATNVVRLSGERNIPITDLHRFFESETIFGNAGRELDQIIHEAEKYEAEAAQLTPRTAALLGMTRSMQSNLQTMQNGLQAMQGNITTLTNRADQQERRQLEEREAAQKRAVDLEREEQIHLERPPTAREVGGALLGASSFIVAGMAGRVAAAYMDNDPNTNAEQAVQFSAFDSLHTGMQFLNVTSTIATHGVREGVRQLNAQAPAQVSSALFHGAREYSLTLQNEQVSLNQRKARALADKVEERLEQLEAAEQARKKAEEKAAEEQKWFWQR